MQSQSVKSALLALVLLGFAAPGAEAQDAAASAGGGGDGPGSDSQGLTIFTPNNSRASQGLAVAGWMLYPSFYGGYIYNDNAYATRTNRVGLSGIQIAPSLEGMLDNGLHKTSISLGATGVLYPGAGGENLNNYLTQTSTHNVQPTNVTGHANVTEVWAPRADWTVILNGNFIRTNGLFGASNPANGFGVGTAGVSAPALTPSYIPTIGTFSPQQQYINEYGGQLSIEHRFNEQASLRATGYVQGVSYDSTPTTTQYVGGVPLQQSNGPSSNGTSYGAMLRGSFHATPQIYVYVEPGVDLRRYGSSTQDSNGYRVTAGAGSDLVGLFQGEVFGGYQGQTSVYGYFGSQSAPAYGGRIRYFPTPLLTLSLNVDSTLGSIQPTRAGVFQPFGFLAVPQSFANASYTQQGMRRRTMASTHTRP